MSETIIVAVISLVGTVLGSFFGILSANKLVNFRIEKLESEVRESNEQVKRIYALETHNTVQDTRITHLEEETDRIIIDIRKLKGA